MNEFFLKFNCLKDIKPAEKFMKLHGYHCDDTLIPDAILLALSAKDDYLTGKVSCSPFSSVDSFMKALDKIINDNYCSGDIVDKVLETISYSDKMLRVRAYSDGEFMLVYDTMVADIPIYKFDPSIDIDSPEMKLAIALGHMPYERVLNG